MATQEIEIPGRVPAAELTDSPTILFDVQTVPEGERPFGLVIDNSTGSFQILFNNPERTMVGGVLDSVSQADRRAQVTQAFKEVLLRTSFLGLETIEKSVLREKYGLSNLPPKKDLEVASALGLQHRGYVSTIHRHALDKLGLLEINDRLIAYRSQNYDMLTETASSFDEREAVERVRSGDLDAFSVIYETHFNSIRGFLRKSLKDPQIADDLAHEVFIKALENLPGSDFSYRGERQFRAWLFQIARRTVINRLRKNSVHEVQTNFVTDGPAQNRLTEDPTSVVIEAIWVAQVSKLLWKLVDHLPTAQREVVLCRFVEGLSVKETSEKLGKGEGNVKVLQHKGVRRLGEALGVSR
ncbi:MAG: sigma-70 family RNA polymerase sigma factor [Candidatus Curtissbacteria bacterium]|nr:sigma-70 family RNA polymerase sigma factor [Candidatus Curtissbacteria bacterium]